MMFMAEAEALVVPTMMTLAVTLQSRPNRIIFRR